MKALKIRLYPKKEQEKLILKSVGVARFVFNRALAMKKKRYEEFGENLSWVEISKMVTFWKKTEELDWLKDVSSSIPTQSLMNLDRAYNNFFKLGRGFPKFKKKAYGGSFVLSDPSRLIGDKHIKLPRLGEVKIRGLRKFSGKIKNVTVSVNKSGQIFATFAVEDFEKKVKPKSKPKKKEVGIDLNLENFLTDSNKQRIENPRFKKIHEKRIKFLQRKFAKQKQVTNDFGKKINSKRREKTRIKIAREFQKIENKKQDFLHKLSNDYAKNHSKVVVEDLKIQNMVKNHKLAEAISMVAWGEFKRQLKYKCEDFGTTYIEVAPHNTSKTCSSCGLVREKLSLKEREWTCDCGAIHIRDENSAKNILNKSKTGRSTVRKVRGGIVARQSDEANNCILK